MNPKLLSIHQRLDKELPYFSECTLKIKAKEGGVLVPFIFNRAQQYLHFKLEQQRKKLGRVRAYVLKGRQQGCCLTPDMRVLTADYRWMPIGRLPVGEKVFATDEEYKGFTKHGRKAEKRMRIATIEAKVILRKKVYQIELDNGVTLKATREHRFLCRKRSGKTTQWRKVSKITVGDYIRAFCYAPEEKPLGFEDGWFSGFLDGEGSFGAHPQIRIGVSQVDGPVLDRAKKYLNDTGINFYELIDKRKHKDYSDSGKDVHCLRVDRMIDVLKLLIRTRPSRFLNRYLFNNKKLPKTVSGFNAWPKVLSITSLGEQEVIDLQTSEKTFICEGVVSHNSTYVAARYYHKSTRKQGKSVFILSHEGKTTGKLFDIVKRYRDNAPAPIRPELAASNKNQLKFEGINSDYSVGTAGSPDVGRGGTVQYFHGSEIGFWENTDDIQTGVLQSIADIDGTEIILESTANGMSNMFYRGCMNAIKGIGDYIMVFLPWWWQDEYEREPEIGFTLTKDESDYKLLHLEEFSEERALRKICWMRFKKIELQSDWKWKREYPANPQEAFSHSGTSLIGANKIMMARKSKITDHIAPLIGGCDPARKNDRGVISLRRGREWVKYIVYKPAKVELKDHEAAAIIAKIIDQTGMKKMFVDVAYGYGIIDILQKSGYDKIVVGVHFSERAIENDIFLNKRAEMFISARDWFNGEGVSIPDDDAVQIDIQVIPDFRENTRKLIFFEPKDKIIAECGFSYDIWDSFILTFAYPVSQSIEERRFRKKSSFKKRKSPLTTLSRVREKVSQGSAINVSSREIYGGM